MAWYNDANWKNPSSHVDTAYWVHEERAYDLEIGPTHYAQTGSKNEFLTLEMASAILCEAIRVWAYTNGTPSYIDLDIYYDGAWCHIYDGMFTDKDWITIELPKVYQVLPISKARISFDWGSGGGGANVGALQFGIVTKGSWGQLKGILEENRQIANDEQMAPITECPNCDYGPLVENSRGELLCKICGWRGMK